MRNIGLIACTSVLLAASCGLASAQTLHVTTPNAYEPAWEGGFRPIQEARLSTPIQRLPNAVNPVSVGASCSSLACPGFLVLGVGY